MASKAAIADGASSVVPKKPCAKCQGKMPSGREFVGEKRGKAELDGEQQQHGAEEMNGLGLGAAGKAAAALLPQHTEIALPIGASPMARNPLASHRWPMVLGKAGRGMAWQ